MARLTRLAVVSCGLLGVAPEAHHSLAAVYDLARQETIHGVLAEIRFINPHPFVLLDATDVGGKLVRWRLEMDNLSELVQIGFTDDVLRPGDRVAVVGYPARSETLSLYVRRLDRPADGFWYEQVGATPRIGTAVPSVGIDPLARGARRLDAPAGAEAGRPIHPLRSSPNIVK